MKTLTTFKNYPNMPKVTTWNYDPLRGFMTSKIYADSQGTSYTYNPDGQISTRTWARGASTLYDYDSAGSLILVDYSDTTSDISYIRDRLGRPASITDSSGVHALTYNNDSTLASTSLPNILNHNITYIYDSLGRRSEMQLLNNTTPLLTHIRGYDAMSRLETVSDSANSATYTRISGSSLLDTTVVNNGTSDVLTVDRNYDNLNRLTSISNTAVQVKSYTYEYNNVDKRTKTTLADGSYWQYRYDRYGQVTSGIKFDSNGQKVEGQQFDYSFDSIGNRLSSSRISPITTVTNTYTSNDLNQYTNITIPNSITLTGSASPDANLAINQLSQGDSVIDKIIRATGSKYFSKSYTFDNSTVPFEDTFKIWAIKNETGQDLVNLQELKVFVPKNPVIPTYDQDGNLLSDGKQAYSWNGENRCIEIVKADDYKLEFKYDYMGRRFEKKVYTWNTGTSSWNTTPAEALRFAYDNWNLIASFTIDNSSLTINKSYLWGEEGASTPLLSETNHTTSKSYLPMADGNRNIVGYIDSADGAEVASYEYSPFGKTIVKTGTMADSFNFKFSSYYTDNEIYSSSGVAGLVYYGYRYYDANMGRWINRDPIAESGGNNLYGFIGNDGINEWDRLGLWKFTFEREKDANMFRNGTHRSIEGYAPDRLLDWTYQIENFANKYGIIRSREKISGNTIHLALEMRSFFSLFARDYPQATYLQPSGEIRYFVYLEPENAKEKGEPIKFLASWFANGHTNIPKPPTFMISHNSDYAPSESILSKKIDNGVIESKLFCLDKKTKLGFVEVGVQYMDDGRWSYIPLLGVDASVKYKVIKQ